MGDRGCYCSHLTRQLSKRATRGASAAPTLSPSPHQTSGSSPTRYSSSSRHQRSAQTHGSPTRHQLGRLCHAHIKPAVCVASTRQCGHSRCLIYSRAHATMNSHVKSRQDKERKVNALIGMLSFSCTKVSPHTSGSPLTVRGSRCASHLSSALFPDRGRLSSHSRSL